jgi:glycosyltransferase involved in cell wall biosynthesis
VPRSESIKKMRCLYIVPNEPISPDSAGGGAAVFYEHLQSLVELGCEVCLWHFRYESRKENFEQFVLKNKIVWDGINAACKKMVCSVLPDKPTFYERAANRIQNNIQSRDIINPVLRGRGFPILKRLLEDFKPDFIWAQHLPAAQIALLQRIVPVVYSHHDWIYKIKNIGGLSDTARTKRIEENLVKSAAAVVSGSAVELKHLQELGCRNAEYIPIAYDASVKTTTTDILSNPRIVHLGGLGTTANRLGLERFFEVARAKIEIDSADIWIVGDTSQAGSELKKHLENVTQTGFISDLSDVVRPYDIHIIPWEHQTGQRTKLVRAFSYSQAVVAMRAAVSCFPEVVSDKNCLLVDDLEQMPTNINYLLKDAARRKKLGEAARQTFQTHFTRQALLPKFRRVVESVVNSPVYY